ncbi:MAG TPA: glycosyltransferase family 4 protein [Candidatus Solibacter sp.]|nr:glycosyltransferase family 4 protein [Candidatus Solibacter sp.]
MTQTHTPPDAPVMLVTRELGLGGSERQLAETALALSRDGWSAHVACFNSGGFRERELAAAGVPVLELGVRSLLSRSALEGAHRLGAYVARHGIRLVHAFDVPSDLFAVPAARFYRVPVVLSSMRAHRDLTPGMTRHLLRITDRIVDAIVVNSQAVARQLIGEDHVPPSMIRLAYNGLDTSTFCREGARAALPWSDGAPVVGVVCALRPEKGLAVLLDAFAKVRGANLLMVGSGPELASLESRARALGLGDTCRFQPAVANTAEWLRCIDVFVLPSLSEALSNSLLEAMGCGCCPIASDVGGNPELVQDGVTGMLFPAGSVDALAAKLRSVIDDAPLRARLAEAAECRAHREFAREVAARRMSEIYREFLVW